jgi:hypothetical protein
MYIYNLYNKIDLWERILSKYKETNGRKKNYIHWC